MIEAQSGMKLKAIHLPFEVVAFLKVIVYRVSVTTTTSVSISAPLSFII